MARKQVRRAISKRASRAIRAPAGFGAVSTINTAPVSIGNSVRGSAPRINQTTDGARIVGRDFAFALGSTASAITNWEVIGGMPITPACMPSSVLRNYCQMFQKFKVNKLVAHYVTSSPTSQAGDIMFFYNRNIYNPFPDYSNSSFLPLVLSDPHTTIGPQWTNHSILLKPTGSWLTTAFGVQEDISEQLDGSLYLFSKTNAANSPGYLLIDYDISFKQLSVNPRAGVLPVARAQETLVCFTNQDTDATAGTIAQFKISTGKTVSNVVSAAPTGHQTGDIYKVVLQITSSTLVNAAWSGSTTPTTSTLLRYKDDTAITLDDGFTAYARSFSANSWYLYASHEAAALDREPLEWGMSTITNSLSVNICATMSLVRVTTTQIQSAY